MEPPSKSDSICRTTERDAACAMPGDSLEPGWMVRTASAMSDRCRAHNAPSSTRRWLVLNAHGRYCPDVGHFIPHGDGKPTKARKDRRRGIESVLNGPRGAMDWKTPIVPIKGHRRAGTECRPLPGFRTRSPGRGYQGTPPTRGGIWSGE